MAVRNGRARDALTARDLEWKCCLSIECWMPFSVSVGRRDKEHQAGFVGSKYSVMRQQLQEPHVEEFMRWVRVPVAISCRYPLREKFWDWPKNRKETASAWRESLGRRSWFVGAYTTQETGLFGRYVLKGTELGRHLGIGKAAWASVKSNKKGGTLRFRLKSTV